MNQIWYYKKTKGVISVLRKLQVEEKNNPMVITQNGEAKAVLMDVKQYQNISNTINLLKILSIGENDIKNRRIYSHEQIQKKVKSILD